MQRLKVLLAGPYATNYSYARINRGLAIALARNPNIDIKIWKNPSFKIDWIPNEKEITAIPGLGELLTDDTSDIDVLLYCQYPSGPADTPYGLADLPGKTKLLWVPWEETVFPKAKADEINKYAHGVMTISNYCKYVLRNNDIRVPISVVPCALDEQLFNATPGKYPLETAKSFKFLHVSAAKQRKGVDVLLKAYYESFTADDDVSLVIKSFPGPTNMVNSLLGKLNPEYPNHPEVIHLNDPHLTEQDLADLNNSVDAAVYPARVEGFGIPIAEAMYFKAPVITTGYSGQMDFVNSENALLLDYEMVDATDSEAVNLGAKWAEPNLEDLKQKMVYLRAHRHDDAVQQMITKAHARAAELTWDNAATTAAKFIQEIVPVTSLKQKKIAILTTQNTVCGIAEYSRDLYEKITDSFAEFHYIANSDVADRVRPDQDNVLRLWEYGEQKFDRVIAWLEENKPDIFHIQLHSAGHFPLAGFINLVERARKALPEMKLVVTPHTVHNDVFDFAEVKDTLKLFDKILVQSPNDKKYLEDNGQTNVEVFPHPYVETPARDRLALRKKLNLEAFDPIIMTHGLASFHKGILETAEAVKQLKQKYPQILWIAANAINGNNATSASTIEKLQELIPRLGIQENVVLLTDFLEADEVFLLMQASDIGVNAYAEVGESASGVIRKFLAAALPTIVSDIPMMQEYTNEVYKVESNSAENIAKAVEHLLESKDEAAGVAKRGWELSRRQGWEQMAVVTLNMYARL